MKKIGLVLLLSAFIACKENKTEKQNDSVKETQTTTPAKVEENYDSFGKKITAEGALTPLEIQKKFDELKPGDTLNVKFETKVIEVCKKKGCWMKLVLPNDEEPMVRFTDYAFFVPKNIEGESVIVEGKAYITEVSVDDQQHYAKDAGKSMEEINAITEPKQTLSVMADGVLLKK